MRECKLSLAKQQGPQSQLHRPAKDAALAFNEYDIFILGSGPHAQMRWEDPKLMPPAKAVLRFHGSTVDITQLDDAGLEIKVNNIKLQKTAQLRKDCTLAIGDAIYDVDIIPRMFERYAECCIGNINAPHCKTMLRPGPSSSEWRPISKFIKVPDKFAIADWVCEECRAKKFEEAKLTHNLRDIQFGSFIPILQRPDGRNGSSNYQAIHKTFGTVAAIKVPTTHNFTRFLEREFNIHSTVQHPNIIRYYSSGSYSKNPTRHYLATEDASEASLKELVQNNRLSYSQKLSLAVDILDALAYLHWNGVAYRSWHPDSFRISTNANRTRFSVKLSDFSLAIAADSSVVTTCPPHNLPLTPDVAAFEQDNSPAFVQPVNPQSSSLGSAIHRAQQYDIFGACVLIFWMLSGKTPYEFGVNAQEFAIDAKFDWNNAKRLASAKHKDSPLLLGKACEGASGNWELDKSPHQSLEELIHRVTRLHPDTSPATSTNGSASTAGRDIKYILDWIKQLLANPKK